MSTKAKAPDGLEEFKRKHPDFWTKFENDTALKSSKRKDFEKYLKLFTGGDITEYARRFFHSHQLTGPVVSVSHEVLGCVRSKTSLADRVAEALGHDDTDFALALLTQWTALDPDALVEEIEDLGLGTSKIGQYIIWSYRNDAAREDPFFEIEIQDLPCRLGLPGFLDGADHYAFGHLMPPNLKARSPNCLDSDLYEQWVVGGYTKPHAACGKKYSRGLQEIVHRPNKFKNVFTKLMEVPA